MEIQKREGNKVFFQIIIPDSELKEAQTEVFKKNKKHFQLPGFRKGHVPRHLIEKMYGKDVFIEDAINELLPKKYEEAIEELKIEPVDEPEVDIKEREEGKDLVVDLNVDTKPEIDIDNYKGIEAEDYKVEFDEKRIDDEIDHQRDLNARVVNVDRPAEKGDMVNIDFEGYIDDEKFEGGSAKNQDIELGSNTFIPGFEDAIIGKSAGDEFDIDVTFPEDYHEDLKGKNAKFKTVLNSISFKEKPELDDEFIKDISEFDTVEEYRNDLKRRFEEENALREKSQKELNVLNALADKTEIDIPNRMVEDEIDATVNNFAQSLAAQGMSIDQYISMLGTTMSKFRENARAEAVKNIKKNLILDAIIKKENIEASEEELKERAEDMAKNYSGVNDEQKNAMVEYLLNDGKERLIHGVKVQKAVDLLYDNAKFVEPKKVEEATEEEEKEQEEK